MVKKLLSIIYWKSQTLCIRVMINWFSRRNYLDPYHLILRIFKSRVDHRSDDTYQRAVIENKRIIMGKELIFSKKDLCIMKMKKIHFFPIF